MTDREQVEEEIRRVLSTATNAIPLSNQMFRPDGLFSRLADTEAERRVVAQSPLFREAILAGATGIILYHNHPSGDPEPSPGPPVCII